MTFQESIKHCLTNYANFNGKATKSEFWWFFLFQVLAVVVAEIISPTLGSLVSLLLFIPYLAVAVRRLHDVNKSGWWQLLIFTIIGLIPLIYWLIKKSTYEENKWSETPSIKT